MKTYKLNNIEISRDKFIEANKEDLLLLFTK